MSWRKVLLIFQREIRDQMRDRRTLFMIAVLPLLLYPALGIGMVHMMSHFQEQPRTVVLLGENELPETPPLIEQPEPDRHGPTRFVTNWFRFADESDKLDVYTDTMSHDSSDSEADEKLKTLLADAEAIRRKYERREQLEAQRRQAEESLADVEPNPADGEQPEQLKATLIELNAEIDRVQQQLGSLFSSSDIQVLIIFPEGFGERLAEVNRLLRERSTTGSNLPDLRPVIIHNKAEKKSQIAYQRVSDAIGEWEEAILLARLQMADLPATLPRPVNAEPVDLAQAEDISQSLWSVLFPALLIIMSVTGAFYPAIDLVAGEKERGTMETLLICPATRTEIVLGKFLTVMTFSTSTAVLNLLSMGLTGNYMYSLIGVRGFGGAGNLTPPSLSALAWVLVLLVPLAALFSALCLSLATFAKSSKEGQYYLTPLLMVTLGLTVFCVMPTTEIIPFYSVMPIVGPALLLKELLAAPDNSSALLYAIPVLATSVIYSLLALWWAIEQFASEDVLFREAERFEVGLWLRHLLREKESTPSFAEGVVCVVLIFLLQFASYKVLQGAFDPAAPLEGLKLQMIYLVVTVGCPALFMSVMLTTNVRKTLRLRLPSGKMLGLALLLPLALHPLSSELLSNLKWFFPEIPPAAREMFALLGDAELPLWFVLLAFALTPALCEEIAFRGFILSGFSRSGRKWLPIFLSSLAFGIVHMIPQQVFNATLLGIVLGLLVYHSRSLYPAVLFHFVFNALPALLGRLDDGWIENTPANWFVAVDGGEMRYLWPTLAIAAAAAFLMLRWLIQQPAGDAQQPFAPQSADDDVPIPPDVAVKTSVRV